MWPAPMEAALAAKFAPCGRAIWIQQLRLAQAIIRRKLLPFNDATAAVTQLDPRLSRVMGTAAGIKHISSMLSCPLETLPCGPSPTLHAATAPHSQIVPRDGKVRSCLESILITLYFAVLLAAATTPKVEPSVAENLTPAARSVLVLLVSAAPGFVFP